MHAERSRAHVIVVNRRREFSCATLDAAALGSLEGAFRRVPWWRDRWTHASFRSRLDAMRRDELRDGVALVGPHTVAHVPPPFDDAFEPIELGVSDPQLRTLSGEAETRHERQSAWVLRILAVVGVIAGAWLLIYWLRGGSTRVAGLIVGVALFTALLIPLARALSRIGGHWYLLPGAAAIVRPRRKRPADRLLLCTRLDSFASIRLVSTGKSTFILLELVRNDGRRFRRPVSDREALSFLAAWQSPLPPPSPERLTELAGAAIA